MHAVGLRLGKSVVEIGEMERDEFMSWLAFFEILKEA